MEACPTHAFGIQFDKKGWMWAFRLISHSPYGLILLISWHPAKALDGIGRSIHQWGRHIKSRSHFPSALEEIKVKLKALQEGMKTIQDRSEKGYYYVSSYEHAPEVWVRPAENTGS